MTGTMFLTACGSPLLQALAGLDTLPAAAQRRIARDLGREAMEARAQADLNKRFEVGGQAEAVMRAIMHVRLPERSVDERGFSVLEAVRRLQPVDRRRGLADLKAMFRDQYLLLRLDAERAIQAIVRLLPDDPALRANAWRTVQEVLGASDDMTAEGVCRLQRLEALFVGPAGQPEAV